MYNYISSFPEVFTMHRQMTCKIIQNYWGLSVNILLIILEILYMYVIFYCIVRLVIRIFMFLDTVIFQF